MILVDKNIREYVQQNLLISQGYQEDNLNGVSYDLTLDYICENEEKKFEYDLMPGEVVFIRTQEELNIPENILGRIAEKNSRMRQGLVVNGPHYQPGHKTYAFLRVQNISSSIITLKSGIKIAQIMFEQLKETPETPYSNQTGAAYQNETNYKGLGSYEEEYQKQMHEKIDHAKEDLESMSHRIYANVLTIMGILVAIFAMLSINYQAVIGAKVTLPFIVTLNLTLALCIVVMMGIILIFINKAQNKKFLFAYIVVLIALAVAVIVISLFNI